MKRFKLLLIAMVFTTAACSGEAGFYGPDGSIDVIEDVPEDNDQIDVTDITDADVDADADAEPPAVCGNGIVEEGEVCDDGNTITGDGCNGSCTVLDGVDFVANDAVFNDQEAPFLATNPSDDATFVLLYTDWSGEDGGFAGIKVNFYAKDGRKLREVIANTHVVGGNQHSPVAVVDTEGNIFIVWINEKSGTGFHRGLRGTVLDMQGNIITPEFQIDEADDGDELHPAVGVSPDGIFFVVWSSTSGTGGSDIKGRFFNAQGQPAQNSVTGTTGEFTLEHPLADLQIYPQVQYMNGDHWLVAFEDYDSSTAANPPNITALILSPQGVFESIQTINSITAGYQSKPTLQKHQYGYIFCWIDNSHVYDMKVWGVHCRIFGTAMTPNNDDFLVNQNINSSQIQPDIAVTDSGFVVVWEDWNAIDGNGAAIRGRQYTMDSSPVTDEFGINTTYLDHQTNPVILPYPEYFWTAYEDSSQTEPDPQGKSIRLRLTKPQ